MKTEVLTVEHLPRLIEILDLPREHEEEDWEAEERWMDRFGAAYRDAQQIIESEFRKRFTTDRRVLVYRVYICGNSSDAWGSVVCIFEFREDGSRDFDEYDWTLQHDRLLNFNNGQSTDTP